jgi:hypothetical protein
MKRYPALVSAEDPHPDRKIEGVVAPIVSYESYLADRVRPLFVPKVHERRRLSTCILPFPPRWGLYVNPRRAH